MSSTKALFRDFWMIAKVFFPLCHLHNMPFTAKHLPHWISAPYKETVWVCERVADPGSWGNVVCILFMQSAYFLCSVHTFYAVCILFMKTAYSLCSLPTFYAVCILCMHSYPHIFQAICILFAPFFIRLCSFIFCQGRPSVVAVVKFIHYQSTSCC